MKLKITKATVPSYHYQIHTYKESQFPFYEKGTEVTISSEIERVDHISIIENSSNGSWEKTRKSGHKAASSFKSSKQTQISLILNSSLDYAFLEGFLLSLYRFDYYLNKNEIVFDIEVINTSIDLNELLAIQENVFLTRDLVNEPPNKLTSTSFKNRIENIFKEAPVELTILNKDQITTLKMNGLLAVNAASEFPPYFAVITYNPTTAKNKQPYVLVGKGVVYDTGGLSLKPTPQSMDIMKCDMAGAATVVGTLKCVADLKLPIAVTGIIPITDNWIGQGAFAPGDVIQMANNKSVEVLNTDAEGRMILADGLIYAQKLNPTLVIDVATLTGAALRAIGKEGIVCMGTAQEKTKISLQQAGLETHERLVEFPLWDEYFEQLKSEVADFSNLGGNEAGAITAGKFLEQFIDYEWMHLDIAGPGFLMAEDSYRGKHGTGVGVRLLVNFLQKEIKHS